MLLGAEFHYQDALPGYVFQFPSDYFSHPDFRTEWWYYTGNVSDGSERQFGFELVFFRVGSSERGGRNPSIWRPDDIYLAHAAVTDVEGRHFYYSERINRQGPGMAGAATGSVAEGVRIWNGNWAVDWRGQTQSLTALTDDFHFELRAEPRTPIVIQGLNGVSQKADGKGKASHYLSFPLLSVTGTLTVNRGAHSVKGSAWMDHEWFTGQLDQDQIGWDWFSIQLDDGTELMLFHLRTRGGSIDAHSAGSFIDLQGRPHHLSADEFRLEPLRYWGEYPVKWHIAIPRLQLSLECEAAVDNQEIKTKAAAYWEGAVRYSGGHKGVGYLEMTGYKKPVTLQ